MPPRVGPPSSARWPRSKRVFLVGARELASVALPPGGAVGADSNA